MQCLCNVFQKYYSSLKNICSMDFFNSFFDNISFIDNFFIEFRNITFVLQKQLKSEEEKKLYEELKNKYLNNDEMKWFVNTRNEVCKENPFKLEKKIIVDIYCIPNSISMIKEIVPSDEELIQNKIQKEIENILSKIETIEPELYLTIKYVFTANGKELDILKVIENGLNTMHNFIFEFDEKINNSCKLCDILKSKIINQIRNINIKSLVLTSDCTFNVQSKRLIFYDKADILFETKNNNFYFRNYRVPLKENPIFPNIKNIEDMYDFFVVSHIYLYQKQSKNIKPTFIIFYKDNTFRIDSFFVFTKATIYRKANEIAKEIYDNNDIKAVFFVGEILGYPQLKENQIYHKVYSERIKFADKEWLIFTMLKYDLSEKNYSFDTSNIFDMLYIKLQLTTKQNDFYNVTLEPIRNAFKDNYNKN